MLKAVSSLQYLAYIYIRQGKMRNFFVPIALYQWVVNGWVAASVLMPVEVWNSAGSLVVICIELWILTAAFSCLFRVHCWTIFLSCSISDCGSKYILQSVSQILQWDAPYWDNSVTDTLIFWLLNIGCTTATGNI